MIIISKDNLLKLIPSYIIDISTQLEKNNFQAFLVGGSIRDILLGKIPNDFDVSTNASPEEISKIFPKSIPTGAKFGTITVVVEDESGERFDVQVTTYRSEADYIGGRWPSKVDFAKTIEEDLSRRDFTINAMALNLQKLNDSFEQIGDILVDPFHGQKDLSVKIIKAVRNPLERFSEDGLRSVRACRLASQLNFEIENKTFDAISQTLHITKQVSLERLRDEFLKILLKSPKPSKGLKLMKDSGILGLFIPELLEGIDIVQPEFHTEDVFTHSLSACDVAEDSIKVAALFHDIGKPRTRTIDEKGIHFYGHDVVGAEMTEEILRRLKFPNYEIDKIVKLIRWHMFYYPSADWRKANLESKSSYLKTHIPNTTYGWNDGSIRRLIKNVGGIDNINDLMKLRIADATSNNKNDYDPKELDELSNRISEVISKDIALKVSDLDIKGEDLMSNFNLEPGPLMGEILNHLLELVIDDPSLNKSMDLIRLSNEFLKKKKKI